MITYRAMPETRPGFGKWTIQGFDGDNPIRERLDAGFKTEAAAQAAIEKMARLDRTP